MLYLDKLKLESILKTRGVSVNKLSDYCGISRQSIYNMFEDSSVFNSTFEKIRQFLNVDYRVLTSDRTLAFEAMKRAPDRIKVISYQLFEFAKKYKADLLLFSSNDIGKFGPKPDWNFAVYFPRAPKEKELGILRQKLFDSAFPYRIDIVNLNAAPLWYKLMIQEQYVRLHGYTDEKALFASKD